MVRSPSFLEFFLVPPLASDALWNLLLGILDKATLTLGDNRRVDFSRALIFMTSNLGASEMNSILRPNLGFTVLPKADDTTADRVATAGLEAARRRFTPEFMNRIDKTVVFRPLGLDELRKILDLELDSVSKRLFQATGKNAIAFTVQDSARDFLLREGTDARYGARHLKRAVERWLVQPLASLMATGQVQDHDRLSIEFDAPSCGLLFFKEFRETPQVEVAGQSAAA